MTKGTNMIVTRENLHQLSTVARAAENNPTNNALWIESATALRTVLDAFDAALPQVQAADAQAKVNRIMDLSTRTDSAAIARSAELIDALAELG